MSNDNFSATDWLAMTLVTTAGVLFSLWLLFGSGNKPANRITVKDLALLDVDIIQEALRQYIATYGNLPTGSDAEVFRALSGANAGKTVFFQFDPARILPTGAFIDRWKTPLRIDRAHPNGPVVYSCGPNCKDDHMALGSDDIVSL